MELKINASSFNVHDRFCQQDCVRFGTDVWMRSLPMVPYGNDWLLVSGRVEHRSAEPSIATQGCGYARVGLATSGSAVILFRYSSRSCRRLQVGMLGVGDLQGLVDDQQLQIVCT